MSVSKKVEEIKLFFYKKLLSKSISRKIRFSENNETSSFRNKFKKTYSNFRKLKKNLEKKKTNKNKIIFKLKQKIISEISNLINEEESIKITFDKFRSLQVKWNDTGNVPIHNKNDFG